MGWFQRRSHTLEDVIAPTAVRLRGELLAGPRVRSPFTGVESLVFGWEFSINTRPTVARHLTGVLDGMLEGRGRHRDPLNREPSLTRAGEFFLADGLRIAVDGTVIALPLEGLKIRFRAGSNHPAPVDCAWPTFIPEPEDAKRGAVYFVERLLLVGDAVELTATIEPIGGPSHAYRGAAPVDASFIARPDLEPTTLEEHH